MKTAVQKRKHICSMISCFLSLLLALGMMPAAAFAADENIAAGSAASDMFGNAAPDGVESDEAASGAEPGSTSSEPSAEAEASSTGGVPDTENAGEYKAVVGKTRSQVPFDYPVGAADEPDWVDPQTPVVSDAPKYALKSASKEADTLTYGNWKYQLVDGGAAIKGYTGTAATLEIPKTINGTKVVSLIYDSGASASDRSSVWGSASTIKLNENIVTIGAETFYSCTSLTAIDTSAAPLTYIGEYAFVNTGITSFTMPETLVEPHAGAFDGMYSLQDLYFNKNLKAFTSTIPVLAGASQWNVQRWENPVPRSPHVTYHVPVNSANYAVDDGVLYSKDRTVLYSRPIGMDGSTFSVPSSVRHIATHAFFGTEKLSRVILNNGLQTIGTNAFALSSLESVTIPGTVQMIDNYAFCRSKSLVSVIFEDGMTDLWNGGAMDQFFECTALRYVRLPETLTRVGNACFAGTSLTALDIPASVTDINYGAFGDIYTLETVTGGEGLKNINRLSFRNARISSFPFGDNLEYVSGMAFYGCANYPNPAYPAYLKKNTDGDYVSTVTAVHVSGIENYDFAYQVLSKVNAERAKAGLSALTMDAELQNVAMQRAAELLVLYAHTRPTGASCFTASGKMTAENIAAGQTSPAGVMDSWMNSSGHKANILGASHTSIGVGCYIQNGRCWWVQVFGDNTPTAASKPANRTFEHAIELQPSTKEISFGMTSNMSSVQPGSRPQMTAYSNEAGVARGMLLAKSFDWASSNTGVATVDQTGRVTAKAVGTTVISATVKNSSKKVSYTLNVTSVASGRTPGTSGSSGSSETSGNAGASSSAKSTPMHRLYNPYSGEHFYTGDTAERNGLVKLGWRYEGVGWAAPAAGANVYRLYNRFSGDHHFTTSAPEKDACVRAGWTYEGVGWKSGGSRKVYREYNPYAKAFYHNYTASANEHSSLCRIGWKDEGVGWYGV